jgi:DNA-binding NarL/FixJ family response regulator
VTPVRVLTLAAYPTISYGLRAAVEAEGHGEPDSTLEFAGSHNEWRALPEAVESSGAMAVLADIDWSADDLDEAGGLAGLAPVLLLADGLDAGYAALTAGFRGVLLRDSGLDEIQAALRAVAAGLAVVDPRVLPLIQQPRAPSGPPDDDIEPLTPREAEVLELIARGYPNKAIAVELGISEHTVKFHVGSVLAKLGAASRSEAVAIAMRHGMVTV